MGFEGGSQPSGEGKVEVLCKLMREGLDEKLDLWLDIGHLQVFLIDRSLPTAELSWGVRRHLLVCINEAYLLT